MDKILIANWKMNLSLKDSYKFIKTLPRSLFRNNNIIIAPPAPFISYLTNSFRYVNFAAQDVSIFPYHGAYTGEYSADIIKSCGVKYAIIGHSERIKYFQETNEDIIRKISNCFNADIVPIVCVGEDEDARKLHKHFDVVTNQIRCIFAKLLHNYNKPFIVAYEPKWAIGSGEIPSFTDIKEMIELIDNEFKAIIAKDIKIVYGGSVGLENFRDILSLSRISGLLVGGASLHPEIIYKIVKSF